MQRILNIMVSFLLLVATAGIIVNVHYSAEKIYSIGIFREAESCCPTECNCCTDKVEIIQLKEDYLTTNFSFDYIPDFNEFYFAELTIIEAAPVFSKIIESKVHPPGRTIDRCSDLQVFLL